MGVGVEGQQPWEFENRSFCFKFKIEVLFQFYIINY